MRRSRCSRALRPTSFVPLSGTRTENLSTFYCVHPPAQKPVGVSAENMPRPYTRCSAYVPHKSTHQTHTGTYLHPVTPLTVYQVHQTLKNRMVSPSGHQKYLAGIEGSPDTEVMPNVGGSTQVLYLMTSLCLDLRWLLWRSLSLSLCWPCCFGSIKSPDVCLKDKLNLSTVYMVGFSLAFYLFMSPDQALHR